ncbi:MAG TPA: MFS transporter [Chloroflexota bacterium]|nr:MFS transporter [Chloroflexota bacterium]
MTQFVQSPALEPTPVVVPTPADLQSRVGGAIARLPILAPFGSRSYALLWGGNAVSLAGDQFQVVALAVLALDLTGSTAVLGAVLGAQAIPRALLMLVGGVAADRFRPRTVMLAANLLQAVAVALLAVALGAGALATWQLYAYAIASGTLLAFSVPASQALVPLLVPRERLRSANALNSLNFNLAATVFPPLAGLLVARLGAFPAFALDALSFFIVALALAAIRPQDAPRAAASISPLRQLRDGIAAARADRVVWIAIWVAAGFSLGFGGASAVGLPALAKLDLHAGTEGVGILYGAAGAGAVAGAIALGSLSHLPRQGLAAGIVLLGLGVALTFVAAAPSIAVAVPFLVLSGLMRAGCANVYITLVQSRAQPATRGRVMALFMLGVNGLAPLSLALGGVIGAAFGPRALIASGGIAITLAGLYALFSREFRRAE